MSKPDGKYLEYVGGHPDTEYQAKFDVAWAALGHHGIVPKGFRCDGGSTSFAEHLGYPSVGDEMERCYLVHDHINRNPQHYPHIKRRWTMDRIMWEVARQDGACFLKRWGAWRAVRRFGKKAWKAHRVDIENAKDWL